MIKHNQDGAVNGVVISLILASILLVAAMAFGGWAFMSRQDYKNHTDGKISKAVEAAVQKEDSKKAQEFAQAEKYPLRTYNGPTAYGSLVIKYPKTWSAYVAEGTADGGASSIPVDGYFHPETVPSVTANDSAFALRVKVINQTYDSVLQTYASLQKQVDSGKVEADISPYSLPQVPDVVGTMITGTLNSKKTGTVILLPLRSQTIQISTDGDQYADDFNNIILPEISFSP